LRRSGDRRTQYPRGLPAGHAVITTAGELPLRAVIHTVVPIYGRHDGQEAALLADCYKNSLQLALKRSLTSVAFPAISTGAYGFPKSEAAIVSSQAIRDVLVNDNTVKEVRMVFFNRSDANVFVRNQKF